MLVPLTLLTVKVLLALSLLMLPLVNVQLPVLAVMQLSVPPGAKLPVTVALATLLPELTSRTVAVTCAFQLVPDLKGEPTRLLTETVMLAMGVLLPREYNKRLGDPVPAEVTLLGVAVVVITLAISFGVTDELGNALYAWNPQNYSRVFDPLFAPVLVRHLRKKGYWAC